ncbi:hypothetical protein CFAM422_011652 [Trichoderma lentiforme]|uniref:Uncharacterized protein n=1 Tax=Trichoderma lentiforme TaxID=1567552 RepID=A0A9P4X5E5_9HYPO|nr:hypothetical protein CFAM422_011652 [Trichoderma lentiforme]
MQSEHIRARAHKQGPLCGPFMQEASVDLLDESPSRGKEPAGWEQSPLQSCLLLAQQMEWRAAGELVHCQGSSFTHVAYPA